MSQGLKDRLLIVCISALFFLPWLGSVHLFDWDEINFAEAAREMVVAGDYLTVKIDFEPFHEKPPLFFWIQAGSMHIFGINEFAARFPNAVIGIITLIVLYSLGRSLAGRKFGLIWALTYFGSLLPHFYFRSALIDPLFNLLMFLSVYYIFKSYSTDTGTANTKLAAVAGIYSGLAVLTKGPVAILILSLTWLAFHFLRRPRLRVPWKGSAFFLLLSFLPLALWYAALIAGSDKLLLSEFLEYQLRLLTTQDAGHGGPIYYHFVVLLFGCFPASFFAMKSLQLRPKKESHVNFAKINAILLIVVLVIFSLVKTKILHYSSLAYFPLTFFAAFAVDAAIAGKAKFGKVIISFFMAFGILISLAVTSIPVLLQNISLVLPLATDEFTRQVMLSGVEWKGWEQLIGIAMLVGIVASAVLLFKRKYTASIIIAYASCVLTLFFFLVAVAPKIDGYTQSAVIEFYQSKQGCECYLEPYGFKTYAHYFYSNRQKSQSASAHGMSGEEFRNWLLHGQIDRDAYFVTKIQNKSKLLEENNLNLLYTRNGFAFFRRAAHP